MFIPTSSRDGDACCCCGFMAYPTKVGFGNDARQKQTPANLTTTTFRHSNAYRRIPIAIFLNWVRVTRPSAHRMIQLTSRSDFEKGWRRSFFNTHMWNILRAIENRYKRGTHDQYATIGENWHVIEKEMFIKKPPE